MRRGCEGDGEEGVGSEGSEGSCDGRQGGREGRGDEWFSVTTIVDDPMYLNQPFVTSSHFKKEADNSKWAPSPCRNVS